MKKYVVKSSWLEDLESKRIVSATCDSLSDYQNSFGRIITRDKFIKLLKNRRLNILKKYSIKEVEATDFDYVYTNPVLISSKDGFQFIKAEQIAVS